jgi:hypothetical protein
MRGTSLATCLLALFAIGTSQTVLGQEPATLSGPGTGSTAVVTANAPIFLVPDAGRQPLRVAKEGSHLRLLGQERGWANVQFNDPQFGVRTGYVESRFLAFEPPRLPEPIDLSIPDQLQSTSERAQVLGRPGDDRSVQRQAPSPRTPQRQMREGFWFNGALGYGSLGCDGCLDRANGLSGGLVFGGRLSDKWLLGVGTTGWSRETVFGESLTVGTLDARVRFYPSLSSGFFITGGLGIGSISVDGDGELGSGAVVGLGWDVRVGRMVSLTPFWNGFAVRTSSADANVGQIGLGITLH